MINFTNTARAGAIAVSALLGASMFATAADAAIVTLNPAGSQALGTQTSFQTDNAVHTNNAVITFDAGGNFTETGFFRVTAFQLGGSGITSGVCSTPSCAAGSYNIYGTFVANGNGPAGTLTSLTFTLKGDPGANNTFPTTGTAIGGTGDDITLATGALIPGLGNVAIVIPPFSNPSGLTLNANNVTFNPAPGTTGPGNFFEAPFPFNISLQISANVTELASESTCSDAALVSCSITINGGGGNISFKTAVVPEPASLGILGTGLLGLGAAWRRRRARAA